MMIARGERITGTKPNFSGAYTKANEILVKSNVISTFPFSPTLLVKEQTSIVCRTYEKAKKYGLEMTDFGSESAVIMTMGGKSIIFYDESKPVTHVGFSILHELGHPANKHDFRRKDDETYVRYEVETNYFAAQLLMPEQLIREMQKRGVHITKRFLQNTFGVSESAAEKRITTLANTNAEWYSRAEREFDDIILLKYDAFLNGICPPKTTYDFEDEFNRQRERDSWY